MNTKRLMVWSALIVALLLVALTGCSPAGLFAARVEPVSVGTAPEALAPAATATPQPVVASPITSDVLAALEATLGQVYQSVSPSVVYVEVLQDQAAGTGQQILPGWPFDNPQPNPQEMPSQRGSGSGFVWDTDGHIVTNNHVVEGAAKITVQFSDGTIVPATLVGANRYSDLAVIQVDVPADELHPVSVGDSNQVQVGELSIAIGNPFGLESTMTVGFISGLGRSLPVDSGSGSGPSYSIPDVIQTDAPINPGNSGGVLVNDQGQVIGVTAAIASPVRASAGVGFAIPSAIVNKVVPALIADGRYAVPWLGVSGVSLNPDLAQGMGLAADQRGALVIDVVPNSPASRSDLHGSDDPITVDGQEQRVGGDVIIALDEQPIAEFDDLVAYLFRSTEVGQQVTLTVLRDGQQQEIVVTLGERPED